MPQKTPLGIVNIGSGYADEEAEFIRAVVRYRSATRRNHPTVCEMLKILKSLGYRRVAEPQPLPTYERNKYDSSASRRRVD